ncbi:MAG: hypothetical protein ACK2UE_05420 [Anaerolineales bacterium]
MANVPATKFYPLRSQGAKKPVPLSFRGSILRGVGILVFFRGEEPAPLSLQGPRTPAGLSIVEEACHSIFSRMNPRQARSSPEIIPVFTFIIDRWAQRPASVQVG